MQEMGCQIQLHLPSGVFSTDYMTEMRSCIIRCLPFLIGLLFVFGRKMVVPAVLWEFTDQAFYLVIVKKILLLVGFGYSFISKKSILLNNEVHFVQTVF